VEESFAIYAFLLLGLYVVMYIIRPPKYRLAHVPAPILRYFGLYNFINNAPEVLQEGYNKYKGGVFKYIDPSVRAWSVVVAGGELVEEIRRTPDDILSFHHAADAVRREIGHD